MKYATMITHKQVKTGKVTYKDHADVETTDINESTYQNITCNEALKWFRRLGGKESAQKNHTSRGYNIVKLISTSPDGMYRRVIHFEFD